MSEDGILKMALVCLLCNGRSPEAWEEANLLVSELVSTEDGRKRVKDLYEKTKEECKGV